MFGKIVISCFASYIAITGAAWGGILQIEVPADVERVDVLNPTAEVKERLEALLGEELSRNPGATEIGPVAFTKNGEIIYPDAERKTTDGWSDNRLGFEPAGLFLQHPGSWDTAYWHLREVGQPVYNGVYALAEDIFGYPFWTYNITVEWDDTLPEEGYYNISLARIYLKNWRNWNVLNWQQDHDWNDDAAVLTRCMLQAWHHGWQAYWDHFGSMRRAAWIAIHNKLGDDGYELGFNDLYHDDQREDRPYYKCLDNYNTEGLGTRLHNWGDPNSVIYHDIKYWRYGAAGYCWWKVYNRQPNFMYAFNREFYQWLENNQFLWPPGDFKTYKTFADTANNGTAIEGRQFSDWFLRQPILRCDHWCDDICALAVDRTKARVLAYRRYIDGATGEESEVAHSNARVYTEKQNWQGQMERYYLIDVNNGGYGEWDFPIDNPDEAIKVTASYNLQGGPSIGDLCWGIDSDTAYEGDALYGVVTDALGGGGMVTIKKGGVEQATVPVSGKAFRWTPFSAVGPGEYELVYTPPRGGARGYNPQVVVKDVASYFSKRYYLTESAPIDEDGNGIPEAVEAELAAKFCPQLNMHTVNRLMPQTTDISLNTGYYGRWTGNPSDPWDWIKPDPGETMKDVIESFEFYYDIDFISFGSGDRHIDQHEYWPQQYDKLVGEYGNPHVYYNIFKYGGKPVIQFWFFYPYNCWRNDHEGDWEHINVRVSSPNPTGALLEEVIYYFHEKRKSLPHDEVPLIDDTHPLVFVGGDPEYLFFSHETSGGSYWRTGYFADVAPPGIDEEVYYDPNKVFPYGTFQKVWIGKCTQNPNWWWLMFPGRWGRAAVYLTEEIPMNPWLDNGPSSPWHHECWEDYQHYEEYGPNDFGTITRGPNPTTCNETPEAEAAPVGSSVATSSGLPVISYYPSPITLAPEEGGADTPGADVPPADAPGLTSTGNSGGDSLSPGAVAASFRRSGGLATAAPASDLTCAPNPVTNAATITFKLEKPCRVCLAVYDISGRRVATVADRSYVAGEHTVYWQADVPTGVYIYCLEAGGRAATRKVVVAR
jgi:hypothetical protein